MIFLKSITLLIPLHYGRIAGIGITGASPLKKDGNLGADTIGVRGFKVTSTDVDAIEGLVDELLGIEEPDDTNGKLLLLKDKVGLRF